MRAELIEALITVIEILRRKFLMQLEALSICMTFGFLLQHKYLFLSLKILSNGLAILMYSFESSCDRCNHGIL